MLEYTYIIYLLQMAVFTRLKVNEVYLGLHRTTLPLYVLKNVLFTSS